MTRAILALLLAAGTAQPIDATVCRIDRPTQCACLTLIAESIDAGG